MNAKHTKQGKSRRNKETTNYWQSYSDMMAALLLMFILIMAMTLLQSIKGYEEKLKEREEQQAKITEQQEKIDSLVGMKTKLIEALSEEFKDSELKITVDAKTGAITFDSSVLFDFNEAQLKESGETFLQVFLPSYMSVLFSNEAKDYVSEIIIEGHTDTEGEYNYNLKLSQERALSVATYCLEPDNNMLSSEEQTQLREMMTANGKSWSNPIKNEDGTVNQDKSRRVEFKFRLKDDEMIDELRKILEK